MKNHRLTVRGKRILLLFRFFCPNRKSSSSPSPILPRVYAVYFRHSFTGEIFCTYERPALLSSSFIAKVPRMKNPSRFISIRDLCAQQRPSCKFHVSFSRPVFHNPLLNPLPRRNFLRISFSVTKLGSPRLIFKISNDSFPHPINLAREPSPPWLFVVSDKTIPAINLSKPIRG